MEENKTKGDFLIWVFKHHKIPSWWTVAGIIFLFINLSVSIFCFVIALYTWYNTTHPNKKFSLVRIFVAIAILGILFSIILSFLNDARLKGQTELTKNNVNQNNQIIKIPAIAKQNNQIEKTDGPRSSFKGSGTYIVNQDIEPGTYKNSDISEGCYWSRLSNFTGDNDIIANDYTRANAIVTIKSTDVGFKTTNCGTWSQIQIPTTKSSSVPATNTTPDVNKTNTPVVRNNIPTDYSGFQKIKLSQYANNSSAYSGQNISIVGSVTSFLSRGSNNDSNYITLFDPIANVQVMLKINDDSAYSTLVNKVKAGDTFKAYGVGVANKTFVNSYGTQITQSIIQLYAADNCDGYSSVTNLTSDGSPYGWTCEGTMQHVMSL